MRKQNFAKKIQKKEGPSDFVKVKTYFSEILKRKEPLILSVNSPRKIKWDLIIMTLATFNCF
jgi:hypothetical protein